ncbi:MAG TPA: tRNA pseudouridine(38-40) synthase TruA [Ktedonobacteraceae bacterium]|nr:tRNA pseudouridine(38-40) synthase TruA [Ktedonobacteraceae bacterium]
MKLACGIEYDGTGYHGFQRQAEMQGPTIQGTLEAAIARICGDSTTVYGAGRTDAGVHASGQAIHFDCGAQSRLTPQEWMRAMNAVLPDSITVRWIAVVADSFHARYSAVSRSYRYTIWNDAAPSPLRARYSYHCVRPLAVDAMHEASQFLPGRRDFGAFGRSPDEGNPLKAGPHSSVRTILEASCQRQDALIYFDVTADAFLTGMVRRIVGTLLLVGQKRLGIDDFATIVQRAEKTHPGSAAPSHGLCLVKVTYPNGLLQWEKMDNEKDI